MSPSLKVHEFDVNKHAQSLVSLLNSSLFSFSSQSLSTQFLFSINHCSVSLLNQSLLSFLFSTHLYSVSLINQSLLSFYSQSIFTQFLLSIHPSSVSPLNPFLLSFFSWQGWMERRSFKLEEIKRRNHR